MSAIAGTMDEPLYMCSREDYNPISTKKDLTKFLLETWAKDRDGAQCTSRTLYSKGKRMGMRAGQAFMNALPEDEYLRLNNTPIDPFYSNDIRDILISLDYLLFSKED